MKLIGVTGNAGAGKTTFASCMEEKDTVGVIHVDSIIGNFKKRFLKLILQPRKRNLSKSTRENPKVRNKVRMIVYRNKIFFSCFIILRNKIIEREISRQIKEHKRDGKRVIIIDDWALLANSKLVNKMDHVYVLKRKFISRRTSVRNREDATIEDQKVNDMPYALGFIGKEVYLNSSIITNFGSIEELYEKAESEYQEIGELSFDERYFVKNPLKFVAAAASTGGKGKASMRDLPDSQTR